MKNLLFLIAFILSYGWIYSQPANDDISNAFDLTSLINSCSVDRAYTTVGATSDNSPGGCWNTTGGSNVWFSFIASSSEVTVYIYTGGSEGTIRNPYVALWDADGTTQLACESYTSQYSDLEMSMIGLTIGNTYFISVDNHNGSASYQGTFKICIDDFATNDFYERAIDVSGLINSCSAEAAYTTLQATADKNPGSCWNTTGGSNRWFKFTATTSQIKVEVKTGGSEGDIRNPYAALWEADGTTQVACVSYSSQFSDLEMNATGLTSGNEYYITVDNHNGSTSYRGSFTLCLSDAVDYDFYEGAIDVSGLINSCSAEAAYTTVQATADKNPGSCWNTTGGSNRWFKFTATTSQIKVEVKTGGSEGDIRNPYVALWEADGTIQVACVSYSSQFSDLEMNATGLTPGNEYYITVDNHNGSASYRGSFTLCLSDAVDYDFYEGAILLSDLTNWCSSDAVYTTVQATSDLNPGSCWNTTGGSNRWFKFTAATTEINIKVRTGGSEGTVRYPYVALWESDGVTQVGCQQYTSQYSDVELSETSLIPGNTYYISVDNHNGSANYRGTFSLCVNDKVTYDFYEKAIELTDLNGWCSVDAAYTTEQATPDKYPGSCWNTTGGSNRWFKFTAISSMVTIDLKTGSAEGTLRYPYLALWESDGITQVDCKAYTSQYSDLTISSSSLSAGNTYYISVDNHNGSTNYRGTFSLCIDNTAERYYSLASGAWENGSNWSFVSHSGPAAGDYPQDGDVVYMEGHQIDLSSDISIAELNLNVGSAGNTSLNIDGCDFHVFGKMNITNTGNDHDGSLDIINNGSITVNDDLLFQRDGGNGFFGLTLDEGTISVNKTFLIDINGGTTFNNEFIFNNNSSINIAEDLILNNSGGTKIFIQFNNNTELTVFRNIQFSTTGDDLAEIELNNSAQLNLERNFIRGTPAYGILDCNDNATVQYNGTVYLQTMAQNAGSGTGDNFSYRNVIINNSRISIPQVTLEGTVSIPGTLTLSDGILSTSASNLLILESTAICGAGSEDSYVNGPVKKIGNTDFTFPTGNGMVWAPIGIAGLTGDASTEFTATYFFNPYSDVITLDPGLSNVSVVEYWQLNQSGTASSADITLHWKNESRSGIDDYSDLRIARYTGSYWENLGQDEITANEPGDITVKDVSSFSPFTFGSEVPTFNPLPVKLVNFNAHTENEKVILNWETTFERNNDRFIIERANTAENFEMVGTVKGNDNSDHMINYEYTDEFPFNGINYYRLKQVDFDGAFSYSSVVGVSVDITGYRFILYPNPASGPEVNMIISGVKSSENLKLFIYNIQGRLIKSYHLTYNEGTNFEFPVADLSEPGLYMVVLRSGEIKTSQKLFIIP